MSHHRLASTRMLALLVAALAALPTPANPPVVSYVFPAGAQKGTTAHVRIGGLFLQGSCQAEISGGGVVGPGSLTPAPRLWFEGPILPLPDSQRQEDYPFDMKATVRVDPTAVPGGRRLRLTTAQGVCSGPVFMVGDLPEVVEAEAEGDPIPQPMPVPGTANGRLFPREDVDLWEFRAEAGKTVTVYIHAGALNSPVVPRLEILDIAGRRVASQMPYPCAGTDASARFAPTTTGTYRARVSDAKALGGPAHVYRLSVTHEHVPLFHGDTGGKPVASPTITVPAVFSGVISRPGGKDEWTILTGTGQPTRIEVAAKSIGSPLWASVSVSGPDGKEVARSEGSEKADPEPIVFKAAGGRYTVRVADKFRDRGGEAFGYRISVKEAARDEPGGFKLTLPGDCFQVARGGTLKVKVGIQRRGGFNGPVKVAAEGLAPGLSQKPAEIKQGQNAADLEITASDKAVVGACNPRIRGTSGELGAVAMAPAQGAAEETGDIRLAVAFETPFKIVSEYEMTSAARGETHRRKYRIERGGFEGPIRVGMADRQARHLQGVSGPEIVIQPGQDSFEYPALLPPWMEMGRTCRVCVMAWAMVRDPVDGREHGVSFSSTEQNQQMIVVVGPGRLGMELDRATVPAKGRQVVRARLSRDPSIKGPLAVEPVIPSHMRGVRISGLKVPEGATEAEITLEFDEESGPFNAPIVLRATARESAGPVSAEAQVLPVRRHRLAPRGD